MLRILIFILLIGGGTLGSFGQNPNLGIPFIHAYSKKVYQSGSQNIDVAQDSRGLMYFANNNGLLCFDGTVWHTYPLPNATIVRSLAVAENGDIYVGGQNEFGKFTPNEHGLLSFESLKGSIPEAHRSFEDVWDIVLTEKAVFFRASKKIYELEGEKCTVYEDRDFLFLGMAKERVIAQDVKEGLMYLENGAVEKIAGTEVFKNKLISGVLSTKEGLIIATQNDGLFRIQSDSVLKWKTDADDFFIQNHITSASKAQNGQMAFGTDFAGVMIMDEKGESQFLINRKASLLNNKIFCTYFDKSQNLWLGVDNGLNYIELNSPFTQIYPDGELEGSGFAAKVFEDKIYLGTRNGLYVTDWKSHYDPLNPAGFELVKNTKGQTWGLDIVDDEFI